MDEFTASIPDTSDVPAFIKQGIDMSKVQQVPGQPKDDVEKGSVAWTNDSDPYVVNVNQPDIYGKPILNHELTHTFQMTRNPDLGDTSAPFEWNDKNPRSVYEYGGVEALKKATSVAHFNDEQQAEIVKDYKATQDKYLAKAKAGKITDADKHKMYEAHQAYHPLVKQLAAMPDSKTSLNPSLLDEILNRNMPSLDLSTEPPGLPDYSVKGLGVLPADPLLGGKSVPLPPPKKK